MENKVEFKVYGKKALFTDPLTKIGGEKCSYQIPTYQALKGIVESVYWKPTITWVIDQVRVMKAIRTQSCGMKPLIFSGGNSLAIYTYLSEVEYQVQAHFEWNLNRPDMVQDRNEHKHFWVAKRMIDRGGRRDVFLGTRECQGYVEPCVFGEGEGDYDEYGNLAYDLMFHGFDYPDESGNDELVARFWRPQMIDGVIDFIRPDECIIRKRVKSMGREDIPSVGLEEEGLMDGYEAGEVL